jgi:hypothetical protein
VEVTAAPAGNWVMGMGWVEGGGEQLGDFVEPFCQQTVPQSQYFTVPHIVHRSLVESGESGKSLVKVRWSLVLLVRVRFRLGFRIGFIVRV